MPKTIPLAMYPKTGGNFIVLATNPPIKAATVIRITSLRKTLGIDFTYIQFRGV